MNTNNMSMTRAATLYRRGRKLLLHALSLTTDGVWILTEPVLTLSEAEPDAELGLAIRSVLTGSHANIPHPSDWAAVSRPLLKAAGISSWRKFGETATCVEIRENGDTLLVTPTRNLGSKNGFEHDSGNEVTASVSNAKAVGAAVREALLRSR